MDHCRQNPRFDPAYGHFLDHGAGGRTPGSFGGHGRVLFDLLTKPDIELSEKDKLKVKATARELLATLKKEKLVLDWRKRQQARAEVRVIIEKVLDAGLPRVYSPELFNQKSSAVYQHVYDAYFGTGGNVYGTAA